MYTSLFTEIGVLFIHLFIHKKKKIDIQSSPFDLKIVPDVTHPPSSIIENHVGSVCRLGSSISFEIQARDRFENARQCGGDRLRVPI